MEPAAGRAPRPPMPEHVLQVGNAALESWGPSPVQPLLARAHLKSTTKAVIARALLELHRRSATACRLEEFAIARFAPLDAAAYARL